MGDANLTYWRVGETLRSASPEEIEVWDLWVPCAPQTFQYEGLMPCWGVNWGKNSKIVIPKVVQLLVAYPDQEATIQQISEWLSREAQSKGQLTEPFSEVNVAKALTILQRDTNKLCRDDPDAEVVYWAIRKTYHPKHDEVDAK